MVKKETLIQLPKFPDERGNLSFIEGANHIPFTIRRVYWVYDVPGGEERIGHAYHREEEFIVALSGSFDLTTYDGSRYQRYSLNRSYMGVYLPSMTWRSLSNFSTNAVCMVLSSDDFNEADYIRDLAAYEQLVRTTGKSL